MRYELVKRFFLGNPLKNERLEEEKLSKRYALAVFSSDALSSTAYATEEILLVLALAGAGALYLSLPIALAITMLLAIVVVSYRQLIVAYPGGGGAYIVSKENLGEIPSLIAGASLLIDYSLTVAVSVSAGMSAITSAFPRLLNIKIELAIAAVVLLTMANLRGTKESGRIFAIPTYAFIFGLSGTIIFGFYQYLTGHTIAAAPPPKVIEPITLFLILRAFSSGCSALTGVEAISNGVQSFKNPSEKNARITLVWMAIILGSLFLGMTELAHLFQVHPSVTETVVSQITRGIFGTGIYYYFIQFTTALILIVAANTSFAGFPNLVSVMAMDGYMPRQLKHRGYRLAFSNGIVLLAVFAGVLIVMFKANPHALIPLYAVGVFTGFTLSQFGMVRHWMSEKMDSGWQRKAAVNGVGGIVTMVVTAVLAITKFIDGAWIVLAIIPVFVMFFRGINRHYKAIAGQLSLEQLKEIPPIKHNVVILVSSVHVGTVEALKYAQSLNPTIIRAIHINVDAEQTRKVKARWKEMEFALDLEIIEAPYRDIMSPIMNKLREIEDEMDDDIVTVIIPEFVVKHWWQNLLHNQSAMILKALLFFSRKVVVISVPYHLR